MVKMRQFKPDSYSVSKVFNKYFCDVAGSTGHLLEIDDFNNHPSINTIKENTNASNSTFCFVPAGSDYIRKILDNLSLKKAVGCDKISQRVLRRLSSPVLAHPLTKTDKSFSFIKTNKTKQTILFYFKIVVTKLIETQPASSNGYSRRVV